MIVKDQEHHTRSLYIDTESSCWAGPPPPGMRHEIIGVSFVEMDLVTLEITGERSHFVRPKRWQISDHCTKLTGITRGDIQTARTFPEVLASLTEEFSPSKALCCSWGGGDAGLIAAACQQHGLRTPLRNLLDLAQLFQGLLLLKQTASLRNAVSMLALDFDGVPHGALADARNTALLHAALIRRLRRQADPPPRAAQTTTEVNALTDFGEKLRQALEST
jgi:inhibitor of KinA sporulation pathway (predicted exonuclease)